ncbi:sulfurtransferase TusA [Candidatus Photodesmus blepharus]|uniref:Sulfurtransferase TusA n=2 Tax=Candidatus Photodesmus blepharonis TaxID=1179155 RepID=A0A084CNN0_9GAMM|nr:sulfurtransferase TusA [Candidatus Photodesmus blepharus]
MQNGEVLLVKSDDPLMIHDIPNFCRFMNHELLSFQAQELPYQFWIKKGKI